MVETRRLCGALGAEVSGVDLSKPLNRDLAQGLVDAFHEHQVLVFRGQSIDPAAQITFTRLFGEPQEHPLRTRASVEGFPEVLIIETRPGRIGARNNYWHTDISHRECPPAASILHALAVPDGLGDTMFCNMYRALETLSPGLRRLLDGMEAMHSAEATMRRAQEKGTDALAIDSVPPPLAHPVLRTHPHTGRRALFVNPHFTASFAGMTEEESAPLLDISRRARDASGERLPASLGGRRPGDLGQPLHHALRGPRLRRHRPPQAPPHHRERRTACLERLHATRASLA